MSESGKLQDPVASSLGSYMDCLQEGNIDSVFKMFKALECSTCEKVVCFNDRTDPCHWYCSQECFTARKRLAGFFSGQRLEALLDGKPTTTTASQQREDKDEGAKGLENCVADVESKESSSSKPTDKDHVLNLIRNPKGPVSNGPVSNGPLPARYSMIDSSKLKLTKTEATPPPKLQPIKKKEPVSKVVVSSSVVQAPVEVSKVVLPSPVVVVQSAPVEVLPKQQVAQALVQVPPKLQAVLPLPVVTPMEVKKVWTTMDLEISKSLVDSARCDIPFSYNMTKYHVLAVADQDKVCSLENDLDAYISKAPPMTRVPSVNDVVFAPYDDSFSRAKVTHVDQAKGTVDLAFLDYGDCRKEIEFKQCREPQDEIMKKHPIYGVVFLLTLDKKNLLDDIEEIEVPQEILDILDSHVTIKIDAQLDDTFTGVIELSDSKTLNDMVSNLFKKDIPVPTIVKEPEVGQIVVTPSHPRLIVSSPPPAQRKWTMKNVNLSDNLKKECEVNIAFAWNMSNFTVTAIKDKINIEILHWEVCGFAMTATLMTSTPQVDDIVFAPYYTQYFRARVSKVDGPDKIHVVFLDLGDEVTVKLAELRKPSDDIMMKHPVYGVRVVDTDVISNIDIINDQEVGKLMEESWRLVVESQDDTIWTGRLWVQTGQDSSSEKRWSEIAHDQIRSVVKSEQKKRQK